MNTMNTLIFQRFQLTKPLIFEDIPQGHEVCALPEKTIIRADEVSLQHDLAELLAMAKLAEVDPLLVTFFFQKDLTEEEIQYAQTFHTLCQPLQDAWVWRTLRKYAPDIYEQEILEVLAMWESISPDFTTIKDQQTRRIALGLWAILYENPANIANLVLEADSDESLQAWSAYIDQLQESIRKEPSVDEYLLLPEVTNSPYTVTVEVTEGLRHYRVKRKEVKE